MMAPDCINICNRSRFHGKRTARKSTRVQSSWQHYHCVNQPHILSFQLWVCNDITHTEISVLANEMKNFRCQLSSLPVHVVGYCNHERSTTHRSGPWVIWYSPPASQAWCGHWYWCCCHVTVAMWLYHQRVVIPSQFGLETDDLTVLS